jgi:nucleotidyltransferase substrate binding protein (TIGR01987 family)
MGNKEDIRWNQRFVNYERAFLKLKEGIDLYAEKANDLEKEGIIHRFEFTHELAWKVMKDFLESKGIMGIIGSRDATRLSFQNDLIENGDVWMQMIESRYRTVHTYQDSILEVEYVKIVEDYYRAFSDFYAKMKTYLWDLD